MLFRSYSVYSLEDGVDTLITNGSVNNWAFEPKKQYEYSFTTTAVPAGVASGQFIIRIDNVGGQSANLQTLISQIVVIPTVS